MDNSQAKQMLKQVDCHGIPRGFNGGYSELYKYCLESIEKLDKIEQIVNEVQLYEDCYRAINKIKEVLEQDNADKTCDNCKYFTNAEEIHGKTPCGTCGRELINFCGKE